MSIETFAAVSLASAELGQNFVVTVSSESDTVVVCAEIGDIDCQSNCNQPTSGRSNGDVQQRIIGYYEGWNERELCIGVGLQEIPVNYVQYLHLGFASLTPEFDVVPMAGLDTDLLTRITDLKKRNRLLKVFISVGGWTFSDNGTSTQPTFPDMVSSSEKRSTAITKILAFMQQFGFDRVDYDWEYP